MLRAGSSVLVSVRLSRRLATHVSQAAHTVAVPPTRHDWAKNEIQEIYDSPLLDLVYRAASVHRQYHDPKKIQLCTLMNIKSAFPFAPAMYQFVGLITSRARVHRRRMHGGL